MKKLMTTAALAVAATGLGGCATVVNGTSQPVAFQSDPEGAHVELVSGLTCEAPCEYQMKRGKDSAVTFTLDGYEPVTIFIQSRTGGATFGNILAGGIIGGVIDGSNGASNHLYPDPVYVRMVPLGSTDTPVLLNKKGEIIGTVAEHNAAVGEDVRHGLEEQGLYAKGEAGEAMGAQ